MWFANSSPLSPISCALQTAAGLASCTSPAGFPAPILGLRTRSPRKSSTCCSTADSTWSQSYRPGRTAALRFSSPSLVVEMRRSSSCCSNAARRRRTRRAADYFAAAWHADVNFADPRPGRTALHYGIEKEFHPAQLGWLVDHGASPDIKDKNGRLCARSRIAKRDKRWLDARS